METGKGGHNLSRGHTESYGLGGESYCGGRGQGLAGSVQVGGQVCQENRNERQLNQGGHIKDCT